MPASKKESDNVVTPPEKPLTSLVGNLSCSTEGGSNCDDKNMSRWLQRKTSVDQEQRLVSKCGSSSFEAYPDETDTADNNKVSPNLESRELKESAKNVTLYKGLLYSSASSVFFSLSSVIVKYVKDIAPAELAVLRFVGILIFTLPLVVYSREDPFGPRPLRHLLIFRGLVGATSLFMRFVAFRYLPIADASVIIFSIPVFVAVLARIFLKEPCGFFHAFTVFLTLLGIVLITKVPVILANNLHHYTTTYYYGVGAALGSTIFGASVYVVIRKMTGVHQAIIMFNFGWVAIIETTVLTFLTGSFTAPACGLEQWLVILLGIFSFCGQMLLTLALKQEHAGPVAIVRAATDIVLAFIWQIWFFNEIPDIWSISGALLVSSCVVLISIRKWVMSLPENSTIRKKAYLLTI
ncbi:solute carrier family 35 member G1 isoform X2 [Parasteatoda tepidariorum]|uniref:solute carrier family 35 member G1 isoform X2 n=1 Tax=Parasteatoda tepidariorum TaxID=114398 RepID=UPI001C72966B|nr:solute carrier family 35 member G1 isoform X2 [Parasteatoda tepidariorum]